ELVITHSKEIGKTPAKTANAMVLLEEASNSRSILGRDDYDARRWRDQVADARDEITNSRSVVTSALGDVQTVVARTEQVMSPPAISSAGAVPRPTENKIVVAGGEPDVKKADAVRVPIVEQKQVESRTLDIAKTVAAGPPPVAAVPADSTAATSGPLAVGSLKEYATKQLSPTYPPIARTTRTTGVVKLDITVDEQGAVADVIKVSGPTLLQAAAKDAIRRWKFKPFVRDGQPVRATGFISFNFNL
nr:TonB family protein [Blastocatellia bacterium]